MSQLMNPDREDLQAIDAWERLRDRLAAMTPVEMRTFAIKLFTNAGQTAKEIGEAFPFSERTIRRHRRRKPFPATWSTSDSNPD